MCPRSPRVLVTSVSAEAARAVSLGCDVRDRSAVRAAEEVMSAGLSGTKRMLCSGGRGGPACWWPEQWPLHRPGPVGGVQEHLGQEVKHSLAMEEGS